MEEIVLGYRILKPVVTQEECDFYSAMVEAVNSHNDTCGDGDTQWQIEDEEDSYVVAAAPSLTAEELAAQADAKKKAEEAAQLPTVEERLAALEAAMIDLSATQ